MTEFNGDLDALIEEKISTDTDFQNSLVDLSQEEQDELIAAKKAEVLKQEFSSLSEKAKKAEEIAKNQEIRAKKAEAEAKKPKGEQAPKSDYSLKDIRALQDVHDEDVDTVVDWAKFKGISIAEAKQSPHIQSLLKIRIEERKTAEVTATSTTRRGNNSSEALLNKLKKQEEMSGEEMQTAAKSLVAAMKGQK